MKNESQPGGGTGPHQPELDDWISCAPFERLLHIEIELAENARAVLSMPFLYDHAQGAGLMHGGALVSLADTAMVMAIKSILPPGSHFATIELQVRYLRPVTQGVVTARAKLTGYEDRLIDGEAGLFNEADEQVMGCTARFKLARTTDLSAVAFHKIRE